MLQIVITQNGFVSSVDGKRWVKHEADERKLFNMIKFSPRTEVVAKPYECCISTQLIEESFPENADVVIV